MATPATSFTIPQLLKLKRGSLKGSSSSIILRQRIVSAARAALLPGLTLAAILSLWQFYKSNQVKNSVMSYWQELVSWFWLTKLHAEPLPHINDKAPSTEQLVLPCSDEKPAMVVFLRHCGCPFAEKTFIEMRKAADANPNIHFIAVSHSSKVSTDEWLNAIGGPGKVAIIVDFERTLYARWGLGVSGWTHIFSRGVFATLYKLAKEEGIKNRPTSSGNRWQTGGAFAVDGHGKIRWGGAHERSDEITNFDKAIDALR